MSGIFISYRRASSSTAARLIQGRLGDRAVFIDIASIPLGRDFREEVKKTLDSCDVMLAIVEGSWLSALKNEADWVRLEIETAMKRKIPVIPVLIGDTQMPTKDALPQSMENFAFFNAARLDTASRHFDSEIGELIKAIDDYVGQARASSKEDLQTQKTSPQVERELTAPLPKPRGESTARPARNFGLAAAALTASAIAFAACVASMGSSNLNEQTIFVFGGYSIGAPAIYLYNYGLERPATWHATRNRKPLVSALIRVSARTIEVVYWFWTIWLIGFFFFGNPRVQFAELVFVAYAIGFASVAAAVYLFLYKWRWSKRLRARMFGRSPEDASRPHEAGGA